MKLALTGLGALLMAGATTIPVPREAPDTIYLKPFVAPDGVTPRSFSPAISLSASPAIPVGKIAGSNASAAEPAEPKPSHSVIPARSVRTADTATKPAADTASTPAPVAPAATPLREETLNEAVVSRAEPETAETPVQSTTLSGPSADQPSAAALDFPAEKIQQAAKHAPAGNEQPTASHGRPTAAVEPTGNSDIQATSLAPKSAVADKRDDKQRKTAQRVSATTASKPETHAAARPTLSASRAASSDARRRFASHKSARSNTTDTNWTATFFKIH